MDSRNCGCVCILFFTCVAYFVLRKWYSFAVNKSATIPQILLQHFSVEVWDAEQIKYTSSSLPNNSLSQYLLPDTFNFQQHFRVKRSGLVDPPYTDDDPIQVMELVPNRYYLYKRKETWDGAKERCKKDNRQLAALVTRDDALQVIDAIFYVSHFSRAYEWKHQPEELGLDRNYWMGLFDFGHEGLWEWVDGRGPLTYHDLWTKHQPDHVFPNGTPASNRIQHCAGLWNPVYFKSTPTHPKKHSFDDKECTHELYFICDNNVRAPPPEPTTTTTTLQPETTTTTTTLATTTSTTITTTTTTTTKATTTTTTPTTTTTTPTTTTKPTTTTTTTTTTKPTTTTTTPTTTTTTKPTTTTTTTTTTKPTTKATTRATTTKSKTCPKECPNEFQRPVYEYSKKRKTYVRKCSNGILNCRAATDCERAGCVDSVTQYPSDETDCSKLLNCEEFVCKGNKQKHHLKAVQDDIAFKLCVGESKEDSREA